MTGKKMKGQFFIIGAILISTMFFLGIPRTAILTEHQADLPYISSNIQGELPRAFNMGLNESAAVGRLKNFTLFMQREMLERRINFTAFWLVCRNQSASDINITGVNSLGHDITVRLNLTSSPKYLFIANGSANSTYFSGAPDVFNMTISFGQQSMTAEWPRNKANMYAFYRLARGEDVIVDSFSA